MNVAEIVGRTLAAQGVQRVFGVVGSGNFHVTNALIAGGARFVPAAHEGGAATMADAYARVSGEVGVLSVHQGPGLTNALTGITEAAKSHTPLLVLAPEATAPRSNFFLDLPATVGALGAFFHRVRAEHAAEDAVDALRATGTGAGQAVVLGLPLDVQNQQAATGMPGVPVTPPRPPDPEVGALVAALRAAHRPVFIAGRGATRDPAARSALIGLADRCGALLAVSAAAKGLFTGEPWNLDICGGFATPLAAELIAGADLVVGWGSTLNMWTTRHGRLIASGATVAQVDLDPAAIGVNRPVDVGVVGDVATVASAVAAQLSDVEGQRSVEGRRSAEGWRSVEGWRSAALRNRIATGGRWRDVSYVDETVPGNIDPRTLSIALDDLLPTQRTVVVDSGNFMGYPSMFLSVPDRAGFCFTQAFQSIGLGLPSALGAAVARPDRLTVAALGDGGFLMAAAELTTAVRLGHPLVIVVYNDAAYGAEVHHFGPDGHPLDTVTFADTDLAAIGRGFGCEGLTVRSVADLAPVRDWLSGSRARPLVIDAKVTRKHPSWWLDDAFHLPPPR
jgi:acetolactate synthase-1/2/3 large subunit